MAENRKVSELSSSFDPLEWAEKRKLAMAKASELRDQRRIRASREDDKPVISPSGSDRVRVVRAESRDSLSTAGEREGTAWEIDLSAPTAKKSTHVRSGRTGPLTEPKARTIPTAVTGRRLTKPPVPSARMRAVTSPAERRKPLLENATKAVVVRPRSARLGLAAESRSTGLTGNVRGQRKPIQPASARPLPQSSDRQDPVTRQMIDRDTLRLENRAMFERAITYWRTQHQLTHHTETHAHDRTCVYVRKRPLFDREREGREFDVVTVTSPTTIVTHNCLFQADLKTPYITHCQFGFSGCFGESASSEQVFSRTSLRIVEHAKRGGVGTIFCFGQTGSGKTHTMTALQGFAAGCLFPANDESHGHSLKVQIVELCGKRVLDLLSVGEKQAVRLRESANGGLVLDGASCSLVESAEQLVALMNTAQERRNTESTGANDVSSRSHAVGIVTLPNGGKLTLVDLAGSERRKDSMWHDKERQREGAEINASLHALKECIRTSSGQRCVAFRLSTLTRILAETFTDPRALLAVIATVSPCATDIEHTVSTLKTVQQLTCGQVEESRQTAMFPQPPAEARIPPKRWTPDQVQHWLQSQGGCVGISKSTTGAMLVRMPESRFVQACGGEEKCGQRLFRLLHDLMRSTPNAST